MKASFPLKIFFFLSIATPLKRFNCFASKRIATLSLPSLPLRVSPEEFFPLETSSSFDLFLPGTISPSVFGSFLFQDNYAFPLRLVSLHLDNHVSRVLPLSITSFPLFLKRLASVLGQNTLETG